MGFWIIALALALLTAALVARPLSLARRSARPRAAHDEQVFRDQLLEVERDMERGVLSAEEARAARIEISRRLLGAAAEREAAPDHQPAPKAASYALAAALLIGAPLGGVALYGQLGAPGLPDQPLASRDASRPGQEIAESRIAAPAPEAGPLDAEIATLQARLAANDADREGRFLLARTYGQAGRFAESWRAYDALIAGTGGDAPSAIFGAMAEAMILAAEGYVSPEAERALEQALRREPGNPVARYYIGLAFAQTGKTQSAMQTWAELLKDSPADAPWVAATRAQIDDLAQATGAARPEIATAPPADPAAARAAMVASVQGLDARLAQGGGGPIQWAQLIRSYAALGMDAEAADAEARARAAMADNANALGAFDAAMAAVSQPPAQRPAQTTGSAANLPGPTADDVANAATMAEDDRTAMIRSMVGRLRERLFDQGGDAEEWARLIQSLGVLGDKDGAAEAYARAAEANKTDAIALAMLKERALLAGATVE